MTGREIAYEDDTAGLSPHISLIQSECFDKPRNMGKEATGGGMAVPIFTEFMADALKGKPPTPFNMPAALTSF